MEDAGLGFIPTRNRLVPYGSDRCVERAKSTQQFKERGAELISEIREVEERLLRLYDMQGDPGFDGFDFYDTKMHSTFRSGLGKSGDRSSEKQDQLSTKREVSDGGSAATRSKHDRGTDGTAVQHKSAILKSIARVAATKK